MEPTLVSTAGVVSNAPAASASVSVGVRLRLRTKGTLAFACLVVYVAAIALFVAHDRHVLLHIVQQLEHVRDEQESLVVINTKLAHLTVEVQHALNGNESRIMYSDIAMDLAAAQSSVVELKSNHPEIAPYILHFEQRTTELASDWSAAKLDALRDSALELYAQVERLETVVTRKGESLSREYRQVNQNITLVAMMMSLFGVVLFGALVTWFFTRLASDIYRLEARATEIIGGYRGKPLELTRSDELGGLTKALNHLQSELVRSEQKKLITWQQRFYRERMAAVGSLAAAVAHEVGNPLSSISGVAQLLIDQVGSGKRPDDNTICNRAELVVEQVERIAAIVRQLADLGATHEAEAELVNVNEAVRNTCNLVRFDKRFQNINIVLALAPASSLPAALAVADHMTQVLMNLLINAADAMNASTGRAPAIRVLTRCLEGEILVSVADNGQGMTPEVLARAFEESFSTKPAGQGRGIGLYLCKMLIEAMNGRIELESTPGLGTSAHIYLPFPRDPLAVG